jgi:hypothetical protein
MLQPQDAVRDQDAERAEPEQVPGVHLPGLALVGLHPAEAQAEPLQGPEDPGQRPIRPLEHPVQVDPEWPGDRQDHQEKEDNL